MMHCQLSKLMTVKEICNINMQISHLFVWENLKSQTARLTQETITEGDIVQRDVVWLVISGTAI